MPSPSGVTPIPVPWSSGLGGSKINADALFDYAKSDGWELVYNTFNSTTVYNPSYFMLYNKYRGVLRTYFYFAPGQNYPSNNIVSEILLSGSAATGSPALNFSGTDVVDIGTNNPAATQLQPFQVSSTGSWYASEFELAYDANTKTTPYQSLQMEWQINPNSIAQISLNGNQTGSLDGTITVPSSKTNFFGSLVNTLVNVGTTVGASEAAGGLGFLVKTVDGKTDNSLQKSVAGAITNGISGTISGFLNGVFGFTKKSTTTQKVSLTINTQITVNGTSTVSSQLFDNDFAIPGTLNNDQAVPFYPAYNVPMGVFYLSAKPTVTTVRKVSNIHSPPDIDGSRIKYTFSLNTSSFTPVFNPAVQAIASIQNIHYDILTPAPTNYTVDRNSSELSEENIAGVDYYSPLYITFDEPSLPVNFFATKPVLVRMSLDVIPNDGSHKVTIVKTFKANVTAQ